MSFNKSKKSVVLHDLKAHPILKRLGQIADEKGVDVCAVGGFVRDYFLHKQVKDIDFVVIGNGIAFARAVAHSLQTRRVAVYKKFGTAMIEYRGYKLEFVGARKESYRENSRKPRVAPADLMTDLARRDFTINAMAVSLNRETYLQLIDPFGGLDDLKQKLIRTPLEPETTFHDDPLRIMRGVRFATQLQFNIHPHTFAAMAKMRDRLRIISQERITDELLKIISAEKPSIGFRLLDEAGILEIIFPELVALKGVEEREGYQHKDVFDHTLMVLDNVAKVSQSLPLRLVALVHDIAKPRTKQFKEGKGWTFHGHEEIGARMLPAIFKRLRLPNDWLKYAQKLTRLHLRPIALTEEECTDSAYRRLLFQAGEDLEDLLVFCRADITSGNPQRRQKHLANFDFVVKRLK
ncbi:MAG: HD domain-containing protein, partial [Calditrichaeota bacterium]